MWLIPVVLSIRFYWWRFITVWTVFSIITGFVSFKATRKPIAGTTPRSQLFQSTAVLSVGQKAKAIAAALFDTDRSGVQPTTHVSAHGLCPAAIQPYVDRLMVSTLVIHVITWITSHLLILEGWKAEWAWFGDP